MKHVLIALLVAVFAIGIASAQASAQDILGPHNVNGHGCASCHAPHSGAAGNGGTNTSTGTNYLWGRDFYVASYTGFSGNTIAVTAVISPTNPVFHTAACLSCHDGNQTQIVGMTGTSVESVDGVNTAPTYLAKDAEKLTNDHPVDVPYDCTSAYNWACSVDATGKITFSGADNTTFLANYGRSVRFYGSTFNGGSAYIECTTCHNPHSVQKSSGTWLGVKSVKPSRFFVRSWYDSVNPASNSATQFCRSCHYSKSNENMGVTNVVTQ